MTKKVNLRIADETAVRLLHAAARSKRSMNAQIEWYVERGLDADEGIGEYHAKHETPDAEEDS